MTTIDRWLLIAGAGLILSGCGSPGPGTGMAGDCSLAANTSPTGSPNAAGCSVLQRDTSACAATRQTAGLSGFWLQFSCRVSLSLAAGQIQAQADGQPDYKSMYFPPQNACYQKEASGLHNPNAIAPQSYSISFPQVPNLNAQRMMGAIVGLALNGVPIFGNFAAPGDDIYQEAMTFDACGAHPQMNGIYHYHSEPYAISNDDNHFIGVMRDGYPIYGRRDRDGSLPTLDSNGGHGSVTADSPSTAVYHYHVNQQTSMTGATAGQKQWFLTTGTYRGTPGTCLGCM